MVSSKTWTILNITLVIFAILLFLNLIGVKIPSIGRAAYAFDKTEPLCVIQWKNEFTPWYNLDRCCLEARRQLGCTAANKVFPEGITQWLCKTGPDAAQVWLNNKAYYYCTDQPVW